MSDSEPHSPTSISSEGSLSGQMINLSIRRPELTANSEEVKLFTVLFSQSTPEEQDFYIDEFFQNMSDKLLLKRYYSVDTKGNQENKKNATNCVKKFLIDPTKKEACVGFSNKFESFNFFETYRNFLKNFKFPLSSSTMSLPQLELLSMLIFSNREPEALSSCNFMVNSVEFDGAFNMKYERGTITYDVENVNELLDWLQNIGIINNVITSNLNLGKISKPANIPRNIEAKKAIKFNKTFFVFNFTNKQKKNTIITMVLGETRGTVTDCKFIVYNITETPEVETYSWDGTIDNMTFHHGCEGGPPVPSGVTGDADDPPGGGGAGKRRYSKSTNKTKRTKGARRTKRRNIKKNKSRRKYGKARNTKRKLRRFHH